MKVIKEFNLEVNKQHILDKMRANPESDVYEVVVTEFDEVYKEIQSIIDTAFYLKRVKTQKSFSYDSLEMYGEIYVCVVTIGDGLGQHISSMFEKGDYLRAMLCENIVDELLFELSCQSYCKLKKIAQTEGVGLSERITPGEQVEIELQNKIVEELNIEEFGINVNDSYVISPFKSMAYLYGVREDQMLPEVDFDCTMCSNKTCNFKGGIVKNTCNILISGENIQSHEVKSGQKLLDVLREIDVSLNVLCNGKGTCGKCKARIKPIMPVTDLDKALLTDEEINKGVRLACQCIIDRDITVFLDECFEMEILDKHFKWQYAISPVTEYLKIDEIDKKIENELCLEDAFEFGFPFTINALRDLNLIAEYNKKNYAFATVTNKKITGVYETDLKLFGIAIDIGTTTIVAQKIDFETGKILKTKALLNPQRKFGADVITRIEYASEGEKQLKTLSDAIKNTINKIVLELNETGHGLQSIVLSGNTTMIQLLLGWYSKALGQFPYRHVTRRTIEIAYKEIFKVSEVDCSITILPALSTYVGGDITSGLINLEFSQSDDVNILIDLGTNGEIAIGNKDRILTTSTAAGPAFEGARLKCGTGSVAGAICGFSMESENEMEYITIADEEPNGLCGTGAMDVLAELIRLKYVDETGLLSEIKFPYGEFKITEDVMLTQRDIRELQLAKSAIQTGVEILIDEYGCSYESIKNVFIAGGFGLNLKKNTLVHLDILPKMLKDSLVIAGNTSLGGSIAYMLNANARASVNSLKKINRTVQLSESAGFNEKFMENIMFKSNAEH